MTPSPALFSHVPSTTAPLLIERSWFDSLNAAWAELAVAAALQSHTSRETTIYGGRTRFFDAKDDQGVRVDAKVLQVTAKGLQFMRSSASGLFRKVDLIGLVDFSGCDQDALAVAGGRITLTGQLQGTRIYLVDVAVANRWIRTRAKHLGHGRIGRVVSVPAGLTAESDDWLAILEHNIRTV